MDYSDLTSKATAIRKRILSMTNASGSSHVGTALSSVDILVTLYFRVLRVDPKNPLKKNRDIFIMSKGHGCTALYATLVERGFAKSEMLDGFAVDNGLLWGHVTYGTMPGIEVSTGSLGHGLSIGLGMALADRKRRIFVLLGDGECDEGSVWEAILFAGHCGLDNLIVMVDYNKLQSFGTVKNVLDLEPFSDKWKSAKWAAKEIDGHDICALVNTLSSIPFQKGHPSVLIAHTIKGKGVSFMENSIDWHYKSPNREQLNKAFGELDEKDLC